MKGRFSFLVSRFFTFCNDFKQLSALLRSQTSPLPSVNACAMFRAINLFCNALRDKLHEKLHSVIARLVNAVEGLNVINGPKCNKVLNVITFCPKWNKVLNAINS